MKLSELTELIKGLGNDDTQVKAVQVTITLQSASGGPNTTLTITHPEAPAPPYVKPSACRGAHGEEHVVVRGVSTGTVRGARNTPAEQ